jgi:membrane associated rhomboid family serine protease
MATSPVSSSNLISLSTNATAILAFGTPALAAVGSLPFLALYFGSAFVGSATHMESFAFPTQTQTPTANQLWYSDHASYHSSSAAAAGLVGFQLGSWPSRQLPIGPLVVRAWIPATALLLFQIFHADNTRQPWYGDMGGLLFGIAFGFLSRGRVLV